MMKILTCLFLAAAAATAHADDLAKQREAHKADIAFWTTQYDGSELKSGEFRCPAPRIPAVSKVNDEIESVSAKMQAWQTCYNNFANHLNAQTPPTKRIPKDVLDLMTKEEVDKATAHIKEVQDAIAESANVNAKLVLADFAAWRNATEAYVDEFNKTTKAARANDYGKDK